MSRHTGLLFIVAMQVSQSGLAVVLMLMGFATAGSREGMLGKLQEQQLETYQRTGSIAAATSTAAALLLSRSKSCSH